MFNIKIDPICPKCLEETLILKGFEKEDGMVLYECSCQSEIIKLKAEDLKTEYSRQNDLFSLNSEGYIHYIFNGLKESAEIGVNIKKNELVLAMAYQDYESDVFIDMIESEVDVINGLENEIDKLIEDNIDLKVLEFDNIVTVYANCKKCGTLCIAHEVDLPCDIFNDYYSFSDWFNDKYPAIKLLNEEDYDEYHESVIVYEACCKNK